MVSMVQAGDCPACVEHMPYGMDGEILLLCGVNEFQTGGH